ncbi:MAG: hypothetical protein HOK65_14255 [Crocinitomicaceae bacterium]|nr:hypothetical protein [Crocinitomicaceae bacterium]
MDATDAYYKRLKNNLCRKEAGYKRSGYPDGFMQPLISLETSILDKLETDKIETIENESLKQSVNGLLAKYLK